MMRFFLALGLAVVAVVPVRAYDGGLTAKTTLTEWTVTYNGQTVCVYTFAPDQAKPYVRELAPLGGTNLLRDSPFDHKHHHALMYAIRVNGVNFWEETPGHGVERPDVRTMKSRTFNTSNGPAVAEFEQTIHWVTEADAKEADPAPVALLIERRRLTLTLDDAAKEVALRWQGGFRVGAKAPEVTLTGSNYNGLGVRFLQELDPVAKHLIDGQAPDLAGTKQDVRPGRYGAVMFDVPAHRATFALFGAPKNANGNFFFSMMRPFPYLSVTQGLDQKPLVYRAGDTFEVDNLVTVYPEVKSAEFLSARAARWAETLKTNQP